MRERGDKASGEQATAILGWIQENLTSASGGHLPEWFLFHKLMRAAQRSHEALAELAPAVASSKGWYTIVDVLVSRLDMHTPDFFAHRASESSTPKELMEAFPEAKDRLKTQKKSLNTTDKGTRRLQQHREDEEAPAKKRCKAASAGSSKGVTTGAKQQSGAVAAPSRPVAPRNPSTGRSASGTSTETGRQPAQTAGDGNPPSVASPAAPLGAGAGGKQKAQGRPDVGLRKTLPSRVRAGGTKAVPHSGLGVTPAGQGGSRQGRGVVAAPPPQGGEHALVAQGSQLALIAGGSADRRLASGSSADILSTAPEAGGQTAQPHRPFRSTSQKGKQEAAMALVRNLKYQWEGPDLGPVATLIGSGGRAFLALLAQRLDEARDRILRGNILGNCLAAGDVRIRRSRVGGRGGRGYFPPTGHLDRTMVPYCGEIVSKDEAMRRGDPSHIVALKQILAGVDGGQIAADFGSSPDAHGNFRPSSSWVLDVGLACMANSPPRGEAAGAELVWESPPGVAERAGAGRSLAVGVPCPYMWIKRFHWAWEEVFVAYGSEAPFRSEAAVDEAVLASAEGLVRPKRKGRLTDLVDLTVGDCIIGDEFRVPRYPYSDPPTPWSGEEIHGQGQGGLETFTWCTIIGHREGQLLVELPDPGQGESSAQLVSLLGKKKGEGWLRPHGKAKVRSSVVGYAGGASSGQGGAATLFPQDRVHYTEDSDTPLSILPEAARHRRCGPAQGGVPTILPARSRTDALAEVVSLSGWELALQPDPEGGSGVAQWPPTEGEEPVQDEDWEGDTDEEEPGGVEADAEDDQESAQVACWAGGSTAMVKRSAGWAWADFATYSTGKQPSGGFRVGEALSRLADRLETPPISPRSELIISECQLDIMTGPPAATPVVPAGPQKDRTADVQVLLRRHPPVAETGGGVKQQTQRAEVQSWELHRYVRRLKDKPIFLIGRMKTAKRSGTASRQDVQVLLASRVVRTLTASSSGHVWNAEGPLDFKSHLLIMGYENYLPWCLSAAERSQVPPVQLCALVGQSVECGAASVIAELGERLLSSLPNRLDEPQKGTIALLGSGGGFWLLPYIWRMRLRGVRAKLVLFAECHPSASAYMASLACTLDESYFTSAGVDGAAPVLGGCQPGQQPVCLTWAHDQVALDTVRRKALRAQRVLISLCCGYISKANRSKASRIRELLAHHLPEVAQTFLVARALNPAIITFETTSSLLLAHNRVVYHAILKLLAEEDEEGVWFDFRPIRINPASSLRAYTHRDRIFLVGTRVEPRGGNFGRPRVRASDRSPTWPPHKTRNEAGLQEMVDSIAEGYRERKYFPLARREAAWWKPLVDRSPSDPKARVGARYQVNPSDLPDWENPQPYPLPSRRSDQGEERVVFDDHSVARCDGRRDPATGSLLDDESRRACDDHAVLISKEGHTGAIDDYLARRESVAYQAELMDTELTWRPGQQLEPRRVAYSGMQLTKKEEEMDVPPKWNEESLAKAQERLRRRSRSDITVRELSKGYGNLYMKPERTRS